MKDIRVRDVMVPLDQYSTVSEDATLFEAVARLEKAGTQTDDPRRSYRAVVVLDRQGKAVGKLSRLDVLRSLEPKYNELQDLRKLSGFGLSPQFLQSMLANFDLWKTPLGDLCGKAASLRVGDLTDSPLESETIDSSATLNEAVHRLVLGHFQSLLVTEGGEVTGILRLDEVFHEVAERMKACQR